MTEPTPRPADTASPRPLRLCLLGAGGMRAPATVGVLARELGGMIGHLALVEPDERRRATFGELALRAATSAGLDALLTDSLAEGLAGADAVAVAVRPGGAESRALDERIARRFGVLGQETIGFGGIAMALRSIPAVLEVAQAMHRHCPGALLVNLTNPVGAVGEALATLAPDVVAVGLCDTPRELLHEARRALGHDVELSYAGLNHLGGLTSVRREGRELLPDLLRAPERFAGMRGARLFRLDGLGHLGALPSDYVWFYRFAHTLARSQRDGGLRGEAVVALDEELRQGLADALPRGDADEAWRRYHGTLAARSATYLAREEELLHRDRDEPVAEPASSAPAVPSPTDLADDGYAGELARVLSAWGGVPPTEGLILDLPQPEPAWGLPAGAVVEGHAAFVDGRWRLLLTPGPADGLAQLVQAQKRCERLVTAGVAHQDASAVVEALATNGAVGDAGLARDLFDALRKEDPAIAATW